MKKQVENMTAILWNFNFSFHSFPLTSRLAYLITCAATCDLMIDERYGAEKQGKVDYGCWNLKNIMKFFLKVCKK